MTDQELKDLVASLAVKSDRLDAQIAANNAQISAQLAATDARIAATDAQLAASSARIDAQIASTQAQMAQTDLYIRKVSAKLDAVAEMLGGVANSNGEVTEEFFFNSLKNSPNIGTMHFDQVKARVVMKDSGLKKAELDILMLNGQSAAIIEVKHRPQAKDVEQLLRALSYYKSTLPKDKLGKKYKIYGGIAGFSIHSSVSKIAKDNGLFVLKQAGLVIASQTEAMKTF